MYFQTPFEFWAKNNFIFPLLFCQVHGLICLVERYSAVKYMINSIQGNNFAEVKLGSKIYPPSQAIRVNFLKIPNNATPWQFLQTFKLTPAAL